MNLMPLAVAAALSLALLRAGDSPEARKQLGSQHSSDATTGAGPPLTAPLEIRVPVEPWAFRANNRWNLVYELHIANIASEACTLKQISVRRVGNGPRPLAALTGKDLDAAIAHPWLEDKAPATMEPASIAVVFMWVSLDGSDDVPAALSHTISIRVGSFPEDLSITLPPLTVNRNPVPIIDPPLRGPDWGAAHGPSNDSRHRRGLLTIEGRSYIAERYAIDWLRITPSGDLHTGSGTVNQDFPGYGAAVFAVADGIVTEVTDDIPENLPGHAPAVPITLRTICGNHVIEQLGTDLYASYCHLQPGIRLVPGTRVRRGQALGLLGNSGSSDAPHLHFELCNANSTLACEGVPYAFASFTEEHREFNSASGTRPQPDNVHSMEIPTDETLVDFH